MAHRELLLEIGCEEMPASWIPGLEAQLAERLAAHLEAARVVCRTPVRAFVGRGGWWRPLPRRRSGSRTWRRR